MPINYALEYQTALQSPFFAEKRFTQDLWNSPSNSFIRFSGPSHVKIPKMTIDAGRQDRNRRTITPIVANYSNDYQDVQLKFDRYWSTLVDPRDVPDTNQILAIANITRQYNLQEKLPEQDRYMFSKLYEEKKKYDDGGLTEVDVTEDNVLDLFDTMMENMTESRVSGLTRILYVTPKVNGILKRAEAKNRTLMISGNGNIARNVYSLDDVQIKVVPSDLMMTMYDFTTGSKTADGAAQIQMMLIANGMQIAPEKYEFVGMDAPSAANSGNMLYYESSFSDVFILDERSKAIEFVTAPSSSTK